MGDATPPANLPTQGSATYTGYANATHSTPDGDFLSYANMSAVANFAERSLDFRTSNTMTHAWEGNLAAEPQALMAAPTLDMSGMLNYQAGQRTFMGNISNQAGAQGQAIGGFFGPNGEELGGLFYLSRPGEFLQEGTFAGKR